MKYYLGGYYLIKLRPKKNGVEENIIYTCSDYINDNLIDWWSYSWTSDNDEEAIEAKEKFKLSDTQINSIRTWVDGKFNEHKIGWINVFTDVETALQYKNDFFSHLSDIKLMALYFNETEREDIREEFKPESKLMGEIGLRLTLLKATEENADEKFLGFDYIGIEKTGNINTFHCHDSGNELSNKFNLTLNNYGLFDNDHNSKQVLEYLNDENNGCEPVPGLSQKQNW